MKLPPSQRKRVPHLREAKVGLFFSSLAAALLFNPPLHAAPMEPPAHWTLVAPPAKSLRPGTKTTIALDCLIDPTWHIYALEEPDPGPIPTEIGLSNNDTAIQLLSVDQQAPRVFSDPFYRQRTSLFEHEAHFTLSLKLPPKPLPKSTALHVSIRYQACNDKVCLAPRTTVVDLPLATSLH